MRSGVVLEVAWDVAESSGGFENILKEGDDYALTDYLSRQSFGSIG